MRKKFLVFLMGIMMSMQLFAVNINTATVEELSSLNGIGASTAAKIVEYRKSHKFSTTQDLMNVKGIGQKKFEMIKKDISV